MAQFVLRRCLTIPQAPLQAGLLNHCGVCSRLRAASVPEQLPAGAQPSPAAAPSNGAQPPGISLRHGAQGDTLLALQDVQLRMPGSSSPLIQGISLEVGCQYLCRGRP